MQDGTDISQLMQYMYPFRKCTMYRDKHVVLDNDIKDLNC